MGMFHSCTKMRKVNIAEYVGFTLHLEYFAHLAPFIAITDLNEFSLTASWSRQMSKLKVQKSQVTCPRHESVPELEARWSETWLPVLALMIGSHIKHSHLVLLR